MPPNEEFLEVQQHVFADEILKQHREQEELRFIAENGLPFRLFAEHLSPEARLVWDRYTHGDSNALADLERAYASFKQELIDHIHQDDPEESMAFARAIEHGDIDEASRIIAAHAAFLDAAEPA